MCFFEKNQVPIRNKYTIQMIFFEIIVGKFLQ